MDFRRSHLAEIRNPGSTRWTGRGPDRLGLVPADAIFHPDDVDCDPWFTQYPFQEGDDLEDDDEEMEVEGWPSGGAGDAPMAH